MFINGENVENLWLRVWFASDFQVEKNQVLTKSRVVNLTWNRVDRKENFPEWPGRCGKCLHRLHYTLPPDCCALPQFTSDQVGEPNSSAFFGRDIFHCVVPRFLNRGLDMHWLLMHRYTLWLQHLQCFLDGDRGYSLFVRNDFFQLIPFTVLQSWIKHRPRQGI